MDVSDVTCIDCRGQAHTVSFILLTHVWSTCWNYKKSTLNRLHIAYHNILKLCIGMSQYKSTSLLCTLFELMYNAASQLLGIWCIDLCVDLIALLTDHFDAMFL